MTPYSLSPVVTVVPVAAGVVGDGGVLDVGLGSSNSRLSGRVAARAAASLFAPGGMIRLRRKRQSDPGFIVGGSTLGVRR